MPGDDPDVQLMLAYRAGDASALSDLYARWAGPLLRYLERMVQERATAEELMQESFLRVHRARDRYRPEARFSTWLFQIGRNLALNELDRARRKRPHQSTDATRAGDPERPVLSLVSSEPSAARLAERRETQERVGSLLAELPERQSSALWLSAVEGHSYAEIASILETSVSSVKALVHRARATLIEKAESDEPFVIREEGV